MSNARELSKQVRTIAFSAKPSVQQSLPAATTTKLNFGTEEFDVGSCYNNSTALFRPTVAGYYQINAGQQADANCIFWVSIFKNDVFHRLGSLVVTATPGACSVVSSIVYLNGTTDFIDIRANPSIASNTLLNGYFDACLITAA